MPKFVANYDPAFLRGLFDEMQATYGTVNLISSFGFTHRWRRQCLDKLASHSNAVICDLMTGMGELVPGLASRCDSGCRVVAVDISQKMCERARQWVGRFGQCTVEIMECDALDSPIESASVDAIVSTFGLKTFSEDQQRRLAAEVHRMLKPGGRYSFLEISVPPAAVLRMPYLFYIDFLIPMLGRLCLGNPDNYRYLGVYTKAFRNCRGFADMLRETGLQAEYFSHFAGCASGVCGAKPV